MSAGYAVVFGSARCEKETVKFLRRLPKDLQQRLHDAMKGLSEAPRGPQSKRLHPALDVHGLAAEYRLRVGDYRVLYDVDDSHRTVVILALRRRSEQTYH